MEQRLSTKEKHIIKNLKSIAELMLDGIKKHGEPSLVVQSAMEEHLKALTTARKSRSRKRK